LERSNREEVAMSLEQSVGKATRSMAWLTPADHAAVELAKSYARSIDGALESGDQMAITKALYLGPHLLNALGALGGTPSGRKALELKEEARGKLAAVRDLREREAPSKKRAAAN
jgi:hypothetical protein